MSSNLPASGMAPENETEGLPLGDKSGKVSYASNTRQPGRSTRKPTSQGRKLQAIDDAQKTLDSLLNPPAETDHPQIISASGASRNQARARLAGPAAGKAPAPGKDGSQEPQLLKGGSEQSSSSLAIAPRGISIFGSDEDDEDELHSMTRVELGMSRASTQLQTVRDRASLLISSIDQGSQTGLAPLEAQALQASRRSATQWASRYATHIVILVIVGALVALGGLKTFTVQGAFSGGTHVADNYTGTDAFDDQSTNGKPSSDSQDYTFTLPRTELGGADAAADSVIKPVAPSGNAQAGPSTGGTTQKGSAQKSAPVGQIVHYTVAAGDSIYSIADKFDLMPETVMGSNGIFDPDEILAVGRVMVIPPVDGMYYVAQQGDTLDSIAHRFQADPSDITGYSANKIANGQVKPGQELVVPGGMMPQRETTLVYTVRSGDTLKSIAARFGVDVPTMLDSNDIPDPDNLQIGSQLRVLPVAGIEYKIKQGDTILSIAQRTGVSTQMILDYPANHLTADSTLQIGQVIMVPGGTPEAQLMAARLEPVARGASQPVQKGSGDSQPQPQPKQDSGSSSGSSSSSKSSTSKSTSSSSSSSSSSSGSKSGGKTQPPVSVPPPAPVQSTGNSPKSGSGSFIWPVDGVITQYFSAAHNGLDLAIAAGTPIHAADAGKVAWSGWRTDGLGYCVMIDHLDGYTTVYGHMIRQPAVYVGQYVSRGQVIGYVGSTGHSTGPHVHFMIKGGSATSHNYLNPLAFLR